VAGERDQGAQGVFGFSGDSHRLGFQPGFCIDVAD
jgi:hypothetical protein